METFTHNQPNNSHCIRQSLPDIAGSFFSTMLWARSSHDEQFGPVAPLRPRHDVPGVVTAKTPAAHGKSNVGSRVSYMQQRPSRGLWPSVLQSEWSGLVEASHH